METESAGRVMGDEVEAGLLIYRIHGDPEILLVRAGGPFWSKTKDGGTWSIPKGSVTMDNALVTAQHQFTQETGLVVSGTFSPLTPIQQKGGKVLQAYAVACDLDLADFRSNEFELEWPPGSGQLKRFPEIEQIRYFDLRAALRKLIPAQWPLLVDAAESLGWPAPRARRAASAV
jgi:predicted NUDIX family NTP pyrophosphohydrolase